MMSAKESLLRFFISQEARQVLLSSRFDTHPVFFTARIKPTQTSNYPSTLSTLTEATNLHWDVRTSLANIKEHSTGMAGLTTETEFFSRSQDFYLLGLARNGWMAAAFSSTNLLSTPVHGTTLFPSANSPMTIFCRFKYALTTIKSAISPTSHAAVGGLFTLPS